MDKLIKCLEGMGIEEKDRVLLQLWGGPEDVIYKQAFEKGLEPMGVDLTWIHHNLETMKEDMDRENYLDDLNFEVYKNKDLVIDLMASPIRPSKDFSKRAINNFRSFMGTIFQDLMQARTFVQLRLPTRAMAESLGMTLETYKTLLDCGLDLDYKQIKEDGEFLIDQLRGTSMVSIQTGPYSLGLSIDQREWFNDCGDGDLPCGEVYTACIEDSACGQILVESTVFMDETYKDLVLTFDKGRLIEASHQGFMNQVRQLDPESQCLGEFGLGTNPNLKDLVGLAIFDEKIKGTCHVALGRNTMFGGKNQGQIHHDLVFRPDQILIDGQKLIMGKQ